MRPQPFQIRVDDAVLEDLDGRLRRARWLPGRADSDWSVGTSPAYLREIVSYWRDGYDWRRHESMLNQFPQFIADLGGARLHFVHQRGSGTAPLPLLLLHGWPDSFYRYYKVIPTKSSRLSLGPTCTAAPRTTPLTSSFHLCPGSVLQDS
jgi:hypothetical protein